MAVTPADAMAIDLREDPQHATATADARKR
jgi:hypothetical protein